LLKTRKDLKHKAKR